MADSQNKYRCIVIDDDRSSIEMITQYIELTPKLLLIGAFLNPIDALEESKDIVVIDFLFLDIKMQVSGLEIAKLLREKIRYIIFITGYPEYALSAFKVQADRFLLKPVSFTKFLDTINQLV